MCDRTQALHTGLTEKPIAAGYDPCCDWPHGNMNIHAPSAGLG